MKSTKLPVQLTKPIFGGLATCARCVARSKRSGHQCNAAAMYGKNVCAAHGGKSTGARTAEGKARQAAANIKTGFYSKDYQKIRSFRLGELSRLDNLGRIAGFISGPKSRGRPSKKD